MPQLWISALAFLLANHCMIYVPCSKSGCAYTLVGCVLFSYTFIADVSALAEEVLVASLRKPPTVIPRRSMDARYDISELKNACTVINTADYCQTTALELEEKIREKCDEAFKEKITLQEERDLFVR